jgi:hypothetical protein
MPKAKTSESPKTANAVQLAVAVIGAVAVVAAAVVANWDRLFGHKPPEGNPSLTASTSTGTVSRPAGQSTQGSQSPIVTGTGGNVTINMGASAATQSNAERAVQARNSRFAGEWDASIVDTDGGWLSRFTLQVDGDTVYGTAIMRGRISKLRDGHIDGNKIWFVTNGSGPGEEPELRRYRGVLAEEEIKFTLDIEGPNERRRVIKFVAGR